MRRKLLILTMAAAVGAAVGAGFGYGPLLRYKSEGVLSMEMGTSEYKRFTELANDSTAITQYLANSPLKDLTDRQKQNFISEVTRGEWHKPIPKVSRADAKELPDLLLQLEQEREKLVRERLQTGDIVTVPSVYLGLRLTHIANNPEEAAAIATWLGSYFKDVATREAVRDQVSKWTGENRQFLDRALERKLKFEFGIEQAQTRAASLKKIVVAYPDSARRDSQQVIDVRKENERFLSPQAQLVAAESEIIDIRERLQKLTREIDQQAFVKALTQEAEIESDKAYSGSESVLKLSAVISEFSKKVKTEAEREKLLSLAADLSQITARFVSQAQFVAKPSIPSAPERPAPLMITLMGLVLSALLAAVYLWRQLVIKLLWHQEDSRA